MKDEASPADSMSAGVNARPTLSGSVGAEGRWAFVCWASTLRREQDHKWTAPMDNLVTDDGRNVLLDKLFNLTGPSTFHIGLIQGVTSSTVFQRSDSFASTTLNWSESTNYSEASLQVFDPGPAGSTAAGTLSNATQVATFSIDTDGSTFGGGFLCSTDTKGVLGTTSASTGVTLYSAGQFNVGNKQADSGDTVDITLTQSATA